MLRESLLIKQFQPIYNRKLRKSLFPWGLFDEIDNKGYIRLSLKSTAKSRTQPISYFHSKKEGNDYLHYVCEKYALCQKLCSLYQTKDACFHFAIKSCNGACVELENPVEYNSRVNQLIDDSSFDNSNFFLIDKGRNKTEKSLVWVSNGHFRGYGYAPFHFDGKDAKHWKRYVEEIPEDKDIKMIIKSFLKKRDSYKLISV